MTLEGLASTLAVLEGAYRLTLTTAQRQVWWGVLRHLPDGAVEQAMWDVVTRLERFPSPAIVWQMASGYAQLPASPTEQPALEAVVGLSAEERAANIRRLARLARSFQGGGSS
jgi:hypothetical protein